ncbi:PAS domain S-box protein [Haloarculaceae archaeon H-GB2-1]|nr:PAS domain S-box protein [Haloarculaceae archaeon H-GB1-1]MEA5406609.1 PAS domain S-box protein [Haloarculaceae archaeon H-GB2-1]
MKRFTTRLDGGGRRDGPLRIVHVEPADPVHERLSAELREAFENAEVRRELDVDGVLDAVGTSAPVCVVSAYDLPNGDALDVLDSLRTRTDGVPFVLFTDTDATTIARRALSSAVTDYVPKDGEGDPFAAVVERVESLVSDGSDPPIARSEDRYRQFVETVRSPMGLLDEAGEWRFLNEAAVAFLGADDSEQLLGEHGLDFVAPHDRDRTMRRFQRVLQQGRPSGTQEVDVLTVDGEQRHTLLTATPVTYDGETLAQVLLYDITNQKRLERELRQQCERHAALFEDLGEPAVETRLQDDAVIVERVNTAFEEVFGFSEAAIEGEPLDPHIVPEHDRETAEKLSERSRQGECIEAQAIRETANGERDFLVRVVPFTVADEHHAYAIYVDVSEHQQRQRRLERQNERLDEFASVVSHDLRNPLLVAQGNLEHVGGHADACERIGRSLDRMEQLIDDVLQLAREGDVEDPQPVSLSVAANRGWPAAAERGTLTVEDDCVVEADPSALGQLLNNLFRNSLEHGSASEEHDPTGPHVRVGTHDDGIFVADDGSGIPESERDQVFEAGHSNVADNTGLGLRIVERIAAAHGWAVHVTESRDGGARFEFSGVECGDR